MQLIAKQQTVQTVKQTVKQTIKKKSVRNIAFALTQASAILLMQNAHADTTKVISSASDATQSIDGSALNDYHAERTPWKIETSVLMYKESDGRVSANEPVIAVSKDFGDEKVLTAKFVLDSLTGATPYGASPAHVAQTFTGPSATSSATTAGQSVTGASGYTKNGSTKTSKNDDDDDDDEGSGQSKIISAGQLPLDSSFKDTRVAGNVGWSQPLAEGIKGSIGGNFSKEYDFASLGLNVGLSHEFNEKNTTISVGGSLEKDSINPVGGAPKALSDSDQGIKTGDQSRTVGEAIIGVTQLLSPNALMQFNYSYSQSNGYLNDPYKILTVVDSQGNLVTNSATGKYTYLYESRPDQRARQAVFTRLKYHFDWAILDTSYRYTSDDWGVKTHTVDTKLRVDFSDHAYYVEPHVRLYRQTQADFYAGYLKQGRDFNKVGTTFTPTHAYASADSRLGAFDATTVGVKVGYNLANDSEVSLRVEKYMQKAKDTDRTTQGDLANLQIQPDLNAIFAQVSYSFKW